jgi:ABC-type proline/glycine betaine transport system ATPase subunit
MGGRAAVRKRREELARPVGLPLDLLDRFPHQLSGEQKAASASHARSRSAPIS